MQPSSLRTEDGRNRLLLANGLRYATEGCKVTYAHARAASVIRDETGRVVGVRGVRIDNAQSEYGGCVARKASKAVVLAGGMFNSFDLLVESDIGPRPNTWRFGMCPKSGGCPMKMSEKIWETSMRLSLWASNPKQPIPLERSPG